MFKDVPAQDAVCPGPIPLALWLAVAKDAQLRAQIARGPGARPKPPLEAERVITASGTAAVR